MMFLKDLTSGCVVLNRCHTAHPGAADLATSKPEDADVFVLVQSNTSKSDASPTSVLDVPNAPPKQKKSGQRDSINGGAASSNQNGSKHIINSTAAKSPPSENTAGTKGVLHGLMDIIAPRVRVATGLGGYKGSSDSTSTKAVIADIPPASVHVDPSTRLVSDDNQRTVLERQALEQQQQQPDHIQHQQGKKHGAMTTAVGTPKPQQQDAFRIAFDLFLQQNPNLIPTRDPEVTNLLQQRFFTLYDGQPTTSGEDEFRDQIQDSARTEKEYAAVKREKTEEILKEQLNANIKLKCEEEDKNVMSSDHPLNPWTRNDSDKRHKDDEQKDIHELRTENNQPIQDITKHSGKVHDLENYVIDLLTENSHLCREAEFREVDQADQENKKTCFSKLAEDAADFLENTKKQLENEILQLRAENSRLSKEIESLKKEQAKQERAKEWLSKIAEDSAESSGKAKQQFDEDVERLRTQNALLSEEVEFFKMKQLEQMEAKDTLVKLVKKLLLDVESNVREMIILKQRQKDSTNLKTANELSRDKNCSRERKTVKSSITHREAMHSPGSVFAADNRFVHDIVSRIRDDLATSLSQLSDSAAAPSKKSGPNKQLSLDARKDLAIDDKFRQKQFSKNVRIHDDAAVMIHSSNSNRSSTMSDKDTRQHMIDAATDTSGKPIRKSTQVHMVESSRPPPEVKSFTEETGRKSKESLAQNDTTDANFGQPALLSDKSERNKTDMRAAGEFETGNTESVGNTKKVNTKHRKQPFLKEGGSVVHVSTNREPSIPSELYQRLPDHSSSFNPTTTVQKSPIAMKGLKSTKSSLHRAHQKSSTPDLDSRILHRAEVLSRRGGDAPPRPDFSPQTSSSDTDPSPDVVALLRSFSAQN